MIEIPFDLSYHFGDDLRETPSNPASMRQALSFLQTELTEATLTYAERVRLLGTLGSCARILHEYDLARQALGEAITLAEDASDLRRRTVNVLRMAHVYQWQGDFVTAERLFGEVLEACQREAALADLLDFAYQHLGKCYFDQARYADALGCFEQALSLREEKGDAALIESTQRAIEVCSPPMR